MGHSPCIAQIETFKKWHTNLPLMYGRGGGGHNWRELRGSEKKGIGPHPFKPNFCSHNLMSFGVQVLTFSSTDNDLIGMDGGKLGAALEGG